MNARPSARAAYAAHVRVGCAAAALAAALMMAGPVRARGFDAVGQVVLGNADIAIGSTSTAITVKAVETIIDWRPDQASATASTGDFPFFPFLAEGHTASFTGSDAAASGYTVLNRVLSPVRAGFEGSVTSRLGDVPGGNVWFSSSNGIYIGPSASFNVGSLVLTANDIDVTGGLRGSDGAIRFRAPSGSKAEVIFAPGARVAAAGGSQSYLAVVAPRIQQGGQLNSTGATALIAAEQVDIKINAGLLDFVVTEGTSDRSGIIHTGSTGGPATAPGQTITMIAIPKTEALIMLLNGNIGYTPAAQASVDGTSVVLLANSGHSQATASIQFGSFGDTRFSSPVIAAASTAIEVAPATGSTLAFAGPVNLTAGRSVDLIAVRRSNILADAPVSVRVVGSGADRKASIVARGPATDRGSIKLAALNLDLSDKSNENAAGGTALIDAAGGTIAIGKAAIDARAISLGNLGTATGGAISLTAERGGSIEFGDTSLNVDASGGQAVGGLVDLVAGPASPLRFADLTIETAGTAGAGSVAAKIAPGSTITIDGNLAVHVAGPAPANTPSFRLQAPDAALLVAGAADLTLTGALSLDLGATGRLVVGDRLTLDTRANAAASGLITAGSVDLVADQGLALAGLQSAGAANLRATSGALTVNTLRSAGPVTASATQIAITSPDALNIAQADATTGDLALAASGDLTVGQARAGRAARLQSGGSLRIGGLQASIGIQLGGASVTAANLSTAGDVDIAAAGRLDLDGSIVGSTITVASSDIAIHDGALIGRRGTTHAITLQNASDNQGHVGGNGSPAGTYDLDNGELGRLFADDAITIRLSRPNASSQQPDSLGDFALRFGAQGNLGTGGRLDINSSRDIAVMGQIRLDTTSAADVFALSGRNITVDPTVGGIGLAGSDGSPGGRLVLTGDTLVAATPTTRASVAALTDPVAIEAALRVPVSARSGADYLRADTIDVRVADRFLVQTGGQSAAIADRRGFAARSLTITTRNPAAVVVINGVTYGSDGVPRTGGSTITSVTANGALATSGQGLDPRSSVNGCFVGTGCPVTPPPGGPNPPGQPMIRPPASSSVLLDPLDLQRQLDNTILPSALEQLSRNDGASLLARNDTAVDIDRLFGTLERLSRNDGSSPLTRKDTAVDIESPIGAPERLSRSDGSSPLVRNATAVDIQSMIGTREQQLLPFLLVTQVPDHTAQTPLIDEPATGVGNDDLWVGLCDPHATTAPCGLSDATPPPGK